MKSPFAAAFVALLLAAAPSAVLAQFMDINTIVSGIGGSKFLHDAANVDDASSVRVVRLSSLAGAEQSAARVAAVAVQKSRDINYLHGSLIINPVAVFAIRNSGVGLDDIISLTLEGDGGATLYANDL